MGEDWLEMHINGANALSNDEVHSQMMKCTLRWWSAHKEKAHLNYKVRLNDKLHFLWEKCTLKYNQSIAVAFNITNDVANLLVNYDFW